MSGANDVAIGAAGLSKLFKVYARPSDLLREFVTSKPLSKPFWALRDVSFEVKRGQVVGIMGRNGAGKSTLLKLLAGTLEKTEGELIVNGRVSSILELGTGFNPEYTGRDNIYLGGLMVGMTRAEIWKNEAWIIEFSELEEFIDQPFKTYSTGMQARLTFATAICVNPDILIVDEALSVGDAKFQRKSFGKIQEIREAGKTILLVSHDINTISTFCDHAVLLERGRVMDQGEPYRIGQVYYKMLFSNEEPPAKAALEAAAARDGRFEPFPPVVEIDAGRISHDGGFAFSMDLSAWEPSGDSESSPDRSVHAVHENGRELSPGHSEHDFIRRVGCGAYSHWGPTLYFSASDNSDPRVNGRAYTLELRDVAASGRDAISIEPVGAVARDERTVLREAGLERFGLQGADVSFGPRTMKVGGIRAEILDLGILDREGSRVRLLESGSEYTLFLRGVFHEDVENPTFGFLIRNVKGVDMYGADTRGAVAVRAFRKGELLEARMRVRMWLTNGDYFLSGGIGDTAGDSLDFRYDAFHFALPRLPGVQHASVVNLEHSFTYEALSSVVPNDQPSGSQQ